MLASIAHDLRSPFNGILSLAKQLSAKAGKMPQERIIGHAHHILSSSLSVYQLLDEMLQWSTQRLQGTHTLKAHRLAPLVDSSFELLEEALLLKQIQYTQKIDPDTHVMADSTLTKAIVRNLLNNAIKFTPKAGSITVESTVHQRDVHILVRNTGEPIPAEEQSKLFISPLLSQRGTEGEKGTGLGLSLCKDFIHNQQGRIWYTAECNGSCFGFSLNKAA